MKFLKKITFLKALITGDNYPAAFETISYGLETAKKKTGVKKSKGITMVKDIPSYFTLEKQSSVYFKSFKTISGQLIDLKKFKDYDDYLAKQFSSKSRNTLKRRLKKLNTCFNIKVKCYYGSINKQDYDSYFEILKIFLVRRFSEKQEYNYEIQYLKEFHGLCLQLIHDKKANMLVIFNENKPISIRINMFFDNVAFYIISGYDIDFAKFNLGSIDMMKNIEWCFENNFKYYDLLKGYDYYKKKWSTTEYYNHTELLVSKKKWWLYPILTFIILKNNYKYSAFRLIKHTFVYDFIKQLKKIKYVITHKKIKNLELLEKKNTVMSFESFEIIHLDDNRYKFLKKYTYDFLFETNEHICNINIHRSLLHQNHYMILGKKMQQRLIFNKQNNA